MRPVKKNLPSYLPELLAASSTGTGESKIIHHALIEALGNYCSYCEMPLSDYHIEHLRPFAAWPEYVSLGQWTDLLLICNDCRANIRVPMLDARGVAAMLWPDRDPSFALHNSPLRYELRPVRYVVLDGERRVLEEERQLVFVVANPQAGSALYEKASNTIAHFQLNMKLEYYDEATQELRIPLPVHLERLDNRLFKRTAAWVDADAAVSRLQELDSLLPQNGTEPAAMRRAFINQIAMTAWYSGNWSVWMTVFYQRTGDLDLMRAAFAGDVHVFAGLNNEENHLFRAE